MTLYGYGIDMNKADELEDRSYMGLLETEKNRVHETLDGNDRDILQDIYQKTPHENLHDNKWDFANSIVWRIYTEACMNPEEIFDPDIYQNEAFTRFINDETNYAFERSLETGLNPDLGNVRNKVLEGLVKRSIEFFSNSYKDENLRCDLRDYVGI